METRHLRGLKIFLIVLCGCLLSTASYFTVDAIVENNEVKEKVNAFLKRKVIECTYSNDFDMNFCRLEGNKTRPAFHVYNDSFYSDIYNGSQGDIIVSHENEMGFPIDVFMNFYAGGHAALIDDDHTIIEIAGAAPKKEDNVVLHGLDYWLRDTTLRDSYIGLTINSLTSEDVDKVMQRAESYLGYPYNYSFVFNTKHTRYCTDIITKAYEAINLRLDEDRFIVTAQDLILSKYCDIFLYKEINKTIKDKDTNKLKGTHNVYFLDDHIDWDFDMFYHG